MYGRADAFLPQALHDLVAAYRECRLVQLENVQMPGVGAEPGVPRYDTGVELAEIIRVRAGDLLTPALEGPHPFELPQPQGRRHIGHVVLEAELLDLVVPVTTRRVPVPRVAA